MDENPPMELPSINWTAVEEDQEWRRKECSKSAPPKLNVGGLSKVNLFSYQPDSEVKFGDCFFLCGLIT